MGKRITAVLQEHDAVLEWLARRYYETEGSERSFFQKEFIQVLGSHLLAIKKAIRPALVHCGAIEELNEWWNAIEELEKDLSDALTANDDPDQTDSAMSRMASRLSYLRAHEGERLAIILTRCLTDGELQLLGGEVMLFLAVRVGPSERTMN